MKRLIGILLCFVLTLSMTLPAMAVANKNKEKLSNLEKQEESLAQQQKNLKKKKKDAKEYIASVDKQLTSVATEIYKTEKDLKSINKKIKKTEKKLEKAKESVKVQTADMTKRIQYMYENGTTEMLDMLLNSEDISDFLNKAEYITDLSSYDRKMLNKLKETKESIKENKETLEVGQQQLTDLKADQKNRQKTLKDLSESKKKELNDYDKLIKNSEASADQIDKEIKEQKAAIAAAEAAEQARQEQIAREAAQNSAQQNKSSNKNKNNGGGNYSNGTTGGGWTWPCPGHSTVSSGYGTRKDPFGGNATYFHSGIDIPAPAGTPVVAASAGTVAWSSYSSSAGNWIGISHGNGVVSVYMHMSARMVTAGTHVNKGQTIGLVGTTGSSTGNHLHFGVQLNGSYVNPLGYV